MASDFQRLKALARQQRANPPLAEAMIRDAEQALGFSIPMPLRCLYSEIGDGGFGPGYGFYSLMNRTKHFPDENIVSLYTLFRKGDPEDLSFSWPYMMLPIVDWGCAIRSCINCSVPSLPMVRFDPNKGATFQFQRENFEFEEWLQAWLDGYDLWENR